jgi:hypothetical protein
LIQPSINNLPLWADHVANVNEVFRLALERLSGMPDLPLAENPLSRKLHICAMHANVRLAAVGRGFSVGVLVPECAHGPDAVDGPERAHEKKRPDFKCIIANTQDFDPTTRNMILDIECKRLGRQAGWNLNQNYIIHGVRRFRTFEHRYGINVANGIMIGYVQNMEMAEILDDVNAHGTIDGSPPLNLSGNRWQVDGVSRLNHKLDRPYNATPFSLDHMWVDLRTKYIQEPAATA